jgi:hypothetical protein
VPSALHPDDACLDAIARCSEVAPVTLATLLPREIVAGKQHARTRIGYHPDELEALDGYLAERGATVGRVLCRVNAGDDPWAAIGELDALPHLANIGAVDWAVEFLDADTDNQTPRASRAVLAVACHPGTRLFFEPLVDLDRTMDTPPGLLDRLCNPRPVFHAVRTLNTVLFSDPAGWERVVAADGAPALRRGGEHVSLSPGVTTSDGAREVLDLEAATIRTAEVAGQSPTRATLVRVVQPAALDAAAPHP